MVDHHNAMSRVVDELAGLVTPGRFERMQAVAAQRLRWCTVVLEDIYQMHNASAIIRSAEGFGIQDIYTIEPRSTFVATESISRGAHQWVTRFSHSSVGACYDQLRAKGYTIYATAVNETARSIDEIAVDKKIALVFGTEQQGLSEQALADADGQVVIPMYGFTQSFNVSVSVGICLYSLTSKIRNQLDPSLWQLPEEQQTEIVFQWLAKTVSGADDIIKKHAFYKEK